MPDRIPIEAPLTEPLDDDMVMMSFVDNAGITRVKTVPAQRVPHVARYGVGASPCFETFGFDDVPGIGRYLGGPDGDLRLIPDLSRLTSLACQPGWAWAPADKFTQDGTRFPACQRAFAARQAEVARQSGLRVDMAFETEWALGRDEEEFDPVIFGPATASSGSARSPTTPAIW